MCTVSYIPLKNGFILTSNRDELISRIATSPKLYKIKSTHLLFPKDEQAAGSWIACDENGQVSCLLNGAFGKHKRTLPYNRSRGKILLESFFFNSIPSFIEKVDLNEVEPFTLIIAKKESLTQLKWDGKKKHVSNLDQKKNHLWSSPTLYPKEVAMVKEQWLKSWLNKYEKNEQNIFQFHKTSHGNAPSKDVKSQFSATLKTVSITQVKVDDEVYMKYYDLLNDSLDNVTFPGHT